MDKKVASLKYHLQEIQKDSRKLKRGKLVCSLEIIKCTWLNMRGFSVTMTLKGNFPSEKAATHSSVTCVHAFVFRETCFNPCRFGSSLMNGIVIIKSLTWNASQHLLIFLLIQLAFRRFWRWRGWPMQNLSDVLCKFWQPFNRAMQMHWKSAVCSPGVHEKVAAVQD